MQLISQYTEFVGELTGEHWSMEFVIASNIWTVYLNSDIPSTKKWDSNWWTEADTRQNEQTAAGGYPRIQGTASAKRDTSLPTALAQPLETKCQNTTVGFLIFAVANCTQFNLSFSVANCTSFNLSFAVINCTPFNTNPRLFTAIWDYYRITHM
jgi:hypothetical protein